VGSDIHLRVLRSEAEIETVREAWVRWQQHPHADLDFFLTIVRIRPEVISPYVLALYRNNVLDALLVGRLERGQVSLSMGYYHLTRFPARTLSFVYGGLLGNDSDENCTAMVQELSKCLKRERAHFMSMHFVKVGSAMHRASARASRRLLYDRFAETRPHWTMKLPGDIEEIYRSMSPKTRQTRRYQVKRLLKRFPTMRLECYTKETDLERVLQDAESVARKTYQRGLGVGFAANQENRERFMVEASRNRFRAYFLYEGDKPVAFFLGTLSGNVLYDNFTAYDPEYGSYSPGTVLFLLIFERLCHDGVAALDFGFGDAPYKAQFGNERWEEVTVSVFAPTLMGVGLNMLQMPVAAVDRLGKRAVANLAMFGSVKKWWRGWARRQASA
jgi:hypothetical protein